MLVVQVTTHDPVFLEVDCGDGRLVKATVAVVQIRDNKVRLGIEAPQSVRIRRAKVESAETGRTVEDLTQENYGATKS
jgi:argonaute-like protein implicated in RNA metabolism and viral defense